MTRGVGTQTRTAEASILVLAIAGAFSSFEVARAEEPTKGPDLDRIEISFKLDPRLVSGVYGGGERWVAPPKFVGASAQDTVEARAEGFVANGSPMRIHPEWISSDPEMVTVLPKEGDRVTIVVNRAGESRLKVVSGRVSREFVVHARSVGKTIQIEIAQPPPTRDVPPAVSPHQVSSASPPPAAEKGLDLGERNRLEGATFLADNEKREGVVTLPSGLQYEIVKAADGRKPTVNDLVVCHYRGTFIDGTEFTSTYKLKRPASLPVGKLALPGWIEALQLMPLGSKWRLFLPSQLAYGERGSRSTRKSRAVGPNATLVFEMELLAIKARGTAKGGALVVRAPGSGE